MPSPLFLAVLILLLPNPVRAAPAEVLSKSFTLDIPAQTLADALKELGVQTRLDIPYDLGLCRGIMAPHVRGTLTLTKALKTLLRNTGLQYEVLDQRSVSVRSPRSPTLETHSTIHTEKDQPCGPKDIPVAPVVESLAEQHQPHAEVLVTGTNIGDSADSASPTAIYSRQDIEEMGAGSLGEFVDRLPQNLSSNSRSTYAIGDGRNGDRGTSVNLLGLGERGTLVLIDGRRIAPSAMGDFVDISRIPVAIIDRIEILTGGAAAIYGADAVAGVFNVILRKHFKGAETDLHNTWPNHSGATQFTGAQTVGTDWNTGNIVSTFNFSRDKPLLGTDRPYSHAVGYDLTPLTRDYDGFLAGSQQISPHTSVSLAALYTKRYTLDNTQYTVNGTQVGPYRQSGVTDQYDIGPTFSWEMGNAWQATAEIDVSANRFTETTTYDPDATPAGPLYTTLSESRVRTLDIRGDGPFVELPGGEAKLALGAGGRWENYHAYGSITAGFAPGTFSRDVASTYGELHLPAFGARNALRLLRRLDFSLAVRAERYSDAGFTANPKFGFIWYPADTLKLRASYGKSFATARFQAMLMEYNTLIVERVPSSACASGSCLVATEQGASPSYRPERSTSLNVGLDWTPAQFNGLQLQADLYSIRYRDQVAMPPDSATLLAGAANFGGLVVLAPSAAYMSGVLARATNYPQSILNLAGADDLEKVDVYLDERIRNLATTVTAGVDFDLHYAFPSSCGVWTVGVSGTQILRLDDRASPASPDISVVDTFANPVSRHYQARLRLQSSLITFNLRTTFVGGYANTLVVPAERVASWMTFDAIVGARLDKLLPGTGVRSRVELILSNALNRDPPYTRTPAAPIGYDPVNANAGGRTLGLRAVLQW